MMARKRKHKDVEYQVDTMGQDRYFKTFAEAAVHATIGALSTGEATIDVLIYSRAGARFYGGSDAVERYNEDPEASVFERYELRGNNLGRVP